MAAVALQAAGVNALAKFSCSGEVLSRSSRPRASAVSCFGSAPASKIHAGASALGSCSSSSLFQSVEIFTSSWNVDHRARTARSATVVVNAADKKEVLIVNTQSGGHAAIGFYFAKDLVAAGHGVTVFTVGEESSDKNKKPPFSRFSVIFLFEIMTCIPIFNFLVTCHFGEIQLCISDFSEIKSTFDRSGNVVTSVFASSLAICRVCVSFSYSFAALKVAFSLT